MTVLFAILRKGAVDDRSYILVLIGVIFGLLSDSITALKTFYLAGFAFEKVTIMLFYGVSQYFIVLGVSKGIKQEY